MFTVPQSLSRVRYRNHLPTLCPRVTIQTTRNTKNAPLPCRCKTSAKDGELSDHRTYHTHPRNTRKPRFQRAPKRKWIGAERVRKSSRLSGKFLHNPSGPRGRRFKSCHSDQKTPLTRCRRCFFVLLDFVEPAASCMEIRRLMALRVSTLWAIGSNPVTGFSLKKFLNFRVIFTFFRLTT